MLKKYESNQKMLPLMQSNVFQCLGLYCSKRRTDIIRSK